jgi:phage terminase Nu1 subunit (DNA packaging protein)
MIDQDRMKSIKIERHLLTVKHIKHLEEEISKLMKQKAELQDQVDRYVDKEMKNDTKTG